MKKGVFRNFAKFRGKHLCQSIFFVKVVGLRTSTLLKRRLWHRCFPKNFTKFWRTPFLQNSSRQLLQIDYWQGPTYAFMRPKYAWPIRCICESKLCACRFSLRGSSKITLKSSGRSLNNADLTPPLYSSVPALNKSNNLVMCAIFFRKPINLVCTLVFW